MTESLSRARILCVGDLMLDRFVQGDVGRISQEAPVPVFRWVSERRMLGGAGNVIANLRALGATAALACRVG
ncbi:MAG: bifunctional heptose 7-phosphate kinase/heptose 1-phosphate adenyltransferase, partial [Kiritimatiellae bacterium]|nr:bifunctional heptose 7-phosphate kinase/heptose 1-phosphate adenyltransferase [Kiritimatiellia bacterium]